MITWHGLQLWIFFAKHWACLSWKREPSEYEWMNEKWMTFCIMVYITKTWRSSSPTNRKTSNLQYAQLERFTI